MELNNHINQKEIHLKTHSYFTSWQIVWFIGVSCSWTNQGFATYLWLCVSIAVTTRSRTLNTESGEKKFCYLGQIVFAKLQHLL